MIRSIPLFHVLSFVLIVPLGCSRDSREEDLAHADSHEGHASADASDHGVALDAETMKEFRVTTAQAGPGELSVELNLPGEVDYDPSRLVHIVPRVPGIVREVRKILGDPVTEGETLAILESRELADAKAKYMAARENLALAETNFNREESLHQKNISSEREYLSAKTALAEARIRRRTASHQLLALGFSNDYIEGLDHDVSSLSYYEMKAPFGGTIVEKHVTLGEKLNDDSPVFTVADLDVVWARLTVYQKNLDDVKAGQTVSIRMNPSSVARESVIDYVTPVVEESTRTASARVVLNNSERHWRPGSFVSGKVALDAVPCEVVVPLTALQTIEDNTVIFVKEGESFHARPVKTGRRDSDQVEIVSGLENGETYVSEGGFTLKAEMARGALEHAGHAH